MKPVYMDFETYWSTEHSLTKMPAIEYVTHPDTEVQSLSMKVGEGPTEVVFGRKEITKLLASVDWSDAMAIGHNMSGFDCMLLAWRFNTHPRMWGCTAAMARAKHSKTVGVSLKALSKELGVGAKLSLEATNTKGKRLAEFSPTELEAMREYNKLDTDLCAALFTKLIKGFPRSELMQIDMTTRMLVDPKFVLDYDRLTAAITEVQRTKEESLHKLAVELGFASYAAQALGSNVRVSEVIRQELASASKFSALLKRLGVRTPLKESPTTPGKTVPALAKTDEEFIALQEHDNPLVAAAARVRLEVKSTLLETRIESFIRAADACNGLLPAPLRYCGADTTGRWSGEHYNLQNLPRINPKTPKVSDALRLSLLAPKGHKVIVADLSGIELRVNHFLWKVPSSTAMYQADPEADLYRAFAAARYGVALDEVTKDQRQLAKVAQLGLGFGAGAPTFQKVAKTMGGLDITEQESLAIVMDWRAEYSEIVGGWKKFQQALPSIRSGVEMAIDPWEMCIVDKEAVRLPSKRSIYYPGLSRETDDAGKVEWWYGEGRHKARIYAGKGVENLVQALARDVIADHAREFRRSTGLSPALMVHDELVYIAPDAHADSMLAELQAIMRKGVSWWPELITWSEGSVGDSYGEAK